MWEGSTVPGDPVLHQGRDTTVRYLDFARLERNEFVVVDQFRVDPPGTRDPIVCDLVLFVNGVPLVVVEAKAPDETAPVDQAVDQLLRYSNQRHWYEEVEGAERLFHYVQLMVATCRDQAAIGTVGLPGSGYTPWRDTAPADASAVAVELGLESPDELDEQQIATAGALRPAYLLDIVENFTIFDERESRLRRITPRYQQFRAVHAVLARLGEDGPAGERGGVVFHTQGSGKSLTMTFLVRKMRTLPGYLSWKVVVVTDRRDLGDQLAEVAALTGQRPARAASQKDLLRQLRRDDAGLLFAMIQKYGDTAADQVDLRAADVAVTFDHSPFPVCNASPRILVLVDEAHRSQSAALHAPARGNAERGDGGLHRDADPRG